MTLRKRNMIYISIIVLIGVSSIAAAESDPTGDVYYFNGPDATVLWELYGERDAIDITDASQSVSGSDITVSITIKGGITDDSKITYYIYLYKDSTSYYAIDYNQGDGMASGNGDVAAFDTDTNPEYVLSEDGKTLSYTFSGVDTDIDYRLWVYAVEHTQFGDIAGEAWYDYAPESEAPYYSGGSGNDNGNDNNGGGNGQGGTPGFEMVTVFIALAAIFLFTIKRKY